MSALQAEMVNVADLKPHPRNYKRHPDDQIQHLMKSIDEHGFYRNVVVARGDTILAGHGVVQAVIRMGLLGPGLVPVVRLDIDPDHPSALKIMTSDNELGKLAETDERVLTDLLRDVMTASDLLGTGYDPMSLSALIVASRAKEEIRNKDAAAEWVGMPEYIPEGESLRVVVHCESDAIREEFMRAIGATVINKKTTHVWSIWWPERQKEDLSSVRFTQRDFFSESAQ